MLLSFHSLPVPSLLWVAWCWAAAADAVQAQQPRSAPPTTNVALKTSVRTSHPVDPQLNPQFLTDGAPFTLVHPAEGGLGAAFWYEIDLGKIHRLDHILLRQRNDNWDINRFSHVLVQLYERPPVESAAPEWSALVRADGSYPAPAEVESLTAMQGRGRFAGRYLRISSDSTVPHSPQLAEVEVYAVRTPRLTSITADDVALKTDGPVTVPARQKRLAFTLAIPEPGGCPDQVLRWRLMGHREDWQPLGNFSFDIPCPGPGTYTFEAHAAHSDGSWDATLLTFPITVVPPFTDTLGFRWLLSSTGLLIGLILMRSYNRRRIERLESKAAVSEERSRIARDMHDDVGARLAQLAILHDVFAREFPQSLAARESLQQLSGIARQAVASLEEVLWTVEPQNDTLAATAEHIAQYTYEYLTPLKISCRIDAPTVWPSVEVRASVRQELNFVMKEALQNVAKHSQATEVLLTLRTDPGHFSVRIEDNGCGMTEAPPGPGHDGLRHMKTRVKSLAGTCTLTPRQPRGTTVAIRIPLSS